MARIVLASWVLFSIPLCIAIGHLYRSAAHPHDGDLAAREVAAMLRRRHH